MESVFLSTGQYLGFINNGYLFSRDGKYLGWIESSFVWDVNGNFRGVLQIIENRKYIILNTLTIQPIPRVPRTSPVNPVLPNPPPNAPQIQLPVGYKDGFSI